MGGLAFKGINVLFSYPLILGPYLTLIGSLDPQFRVSRH